MRTAVTDTSIESYDHLKIEGMAAMKKKIVEIMLHGVVYSRRQLAVLADLETSCVAGRVNELIEDGVLEVCGYINCRITQRKVEAVRLVATQKELFE